MSGVGRSRLGLQLVLSLSIIVPALGNIAAGSTHNGATILVPLAAVPVFASPVGAVSPLSVPPSLAHLFAAAARRSGVPAVLLRALSRVQTEWNNHGGAPTIGGGYGMMDIIDLRAAAHLVGRSMLQLRRSDRWNILAGALLLATLARSTQPHHRLPPTLGGWATALVRYAGMRSPLAATVLLRDIYALLRHPQPPWPTAPGPVLAGLAPHPHVASSPETERAAAPPIAASADYPGALWAPSPNYTAAQRPADLNVSYAVIHDVEGSCAAALNWLGNPSSHSSAHFLVCQDGTVFQLVHIRDIAWHAGNWYINQHSIGIEHEGFRDSGGYTQAQYQASAAILDWLDLSAGLSISLDRSGIFGHENVPDANHTDPGPWWDWPTYMSLVRGGAPYDGGDPGIATVVVPQAIFYTCPALTCAAIDSANWGEEFAVIAERNGWTKLDYGGRALWTLAAALASGVGTRLTVTIPLLNVRDEPSLNGARIGQIPRGHVYVARLIDRSLDPFGWWFIAYNHRYGFISAHYVHALNGTTAPLPTPIVARTPVVRPTQPPTATASATATLSPTTTPSPTDTATLTTTTATPTVTETATLTATTMVSATTTATTTAILPVSTTTIATVTDTVVATVTLTATLSPTPTVSPSVTVTPTASPSSTVTPTASPSTTVSPSPTPHARGTVSASPSLLRQRHRARPQPTRSTAGRTTHRRIGPSPLVRTARLAHPAKAGWTGQRVHPASARVARGRQPTPPAAVTLLRSTVHLGAPLRLVVHGVAGATVRYRIDLPGSVVLHSVAIIDAHGRAGAVFLLPGQRWLHAVLLRGARRRHGYLLMPPVPHSLGGRYTVVIQRHGKTITRVGTFRVVLWTVASRQNSTQRGGTMR